MDQSAYEVVRQAVEFKRPGRLPLRFPDFGYDDFFEANPNQIYPWDHERERENLDEWGCRWVRSEVDNMGQVKEHPLADWRALDHYRWPDPDDPALYAWMEERFARAGQQYVLTGIFFTLFERMHFLHGFENTLSDLYLEKEKIEQLADRILEYDIRVTENVYRRFPGIIHGIAYTDDWGTQQGPIINPKLWREFFKPRYQKLFGVAHRCGWHTWLHSCGRVNLLIDDLIEASPASINLEQPRVLGIEEIGRQFAGQICFYGPCDIQHTLPLKSPEEIEAEAELLVHCWGTSEGGFVAVDKGGGTSYGTSRASRAAMLRGFLRADRWKED